MADFK